MYSQKYSIHKSNSNEIPCVKSTCQESRRNKNKYGQQLNLTRYRISHAYISRFDCSHNQQNSQK